MLKNIDHIALREALGNMCFTAAGLAEGTNANTIQTAAIANYSIDGVLYTKAITDNIAMTAAAAQADLTTCMYLVSIDAAGAVTITKGEEASTLAIAAGTAEAKLPDLPDAQCALGAFKIVLSGGTFTSGTTDLSGTGVTDTFYDYSIMPDA